MTSFERLAAFAEREAKAHFHDHEQRYDQPVETRVAAGTAIDGLVYQGREPWRGVGDCLIFHAAHNDSRLRPGSRLRLSRGDARKPAAKVELIDDHFDGRKYVFHLALLAKEAASDGKLAFDGPEPWVLDEDVFDLLDVELQMLREAEAAGLERWLDGKEPSEAAEDDGLQQSPFLADLHGSLYEAFCRASLAKNWMAVQGPPGSGKTFLLARLALDAAIRKRQRVLITAVSHQAIHNALGQCYWMAAQLKEPQAQALLANGFYKLGSSKANSAGLPSGIRSARVPPDRGGGLIAGATLYPVFNTLEGELPIFDLVLFDEAGQAPLHLALAARAAAAKAIFIGDDQQLPPVVQCPPEEGEERALRMSALHLIRKRYEDPFLLSETRRLNAAICRAVSETFYGDRLSPVSEAAERRLPLKSEPSGAAGEILHPDNPLVFLDVAHSDCRSLSEPEARWAASLCLEAVRCGVAPEEIGIISPYRAQCNRIRFLLQEAGQDSVLVSTVERFQGQEREMVILSMTSSHPSYLSTLRRFLFSSNRLNVAISRARTKVVLLGAKDTLTQFAESSDPDEDDDGCRHFLRVLRHAAIVKAGEPPKPEKAVLTVRDQAAEYAAPEDAFQVGYVIEHQGHGLGVVLGRTTVALDHRKEPALRVRFEGGDIRVIVPRLCRPPLRLVTKEAL